MQKVKGIISIDLLRVIAGIFVVYIHSSDKFIIFENYVGGISWWIILILNVLAKVAVPIFIMISGYLLLNSEKTYDLKNFYKRRILRVGLPLLLWLTIFFSYQGFIEGVNVNPMYVFSTLSTVTLGPLYFLVVIFELYLVAPFLIRALNKKFSTKVLTLFLLLALNMTLFVLRYIYPEYNVSESVATISLPYIFYFYLGGLFRQKNFLKMNFSLLLVVYILISIATALAVHGNLNSPLLSYASPTVVVMSISFFTAFQAVEQSLKRAGTRIILILKEMAGAILGIFLIHTYIINLLEDFTTLKPGSIYSPLWFYIILSSVVAFVVSLAIVLVGRRIPIVRYLFG